MVWNSEAPTPPHEAAHLLSIDGRIAEGRRTLSRTRDIYVSGQAAQAGSVKPSTTRSPLFSNSCGENCSQDRYMYGFRSTR